MRALVLALVLSCCCWSPPALPIRVVGDGEHGVVLAHAQVSAIEPLAGVVRVTSAAELRELSRALGAPPAAVAGLDFYEECLVAVPLDAAVAPRAIEVSSEEGVDVVILDVEPRSPPGQAASVSLLRIARRPCQLAVVMRDQVQGRERTLAVYPGSR